jgi:hypothetical protein
MDFDKFVERLKYAHTKRVTTEGALAKRAARKQKFLASQRSKAGQLGRVQFKYIRDDYINPVTLAKPPYGSTVYQVRNHDTGRLNYYNKNTLFNMLRKTNVYDNYNLLTAFPKKALFKNPMTRGNVMPRNIQRVRLRPAATKIQKAFRKRKLKAKSTT